MSDTGKTAIGVFMGVYLLPIIIGLFILIPTVMFFKSTSTYDAAVKSQEEVNEMWGNVQVNYQRRADLIPNLVNTVKMYAEHEKEVLVAVTEARSKVSQINLNGANLNAANMKAFQGAQSGLSSALSKLMVVVEKYPDLKANQNFSNLQAQLEGTENRIGVARERYNKAVKTYNSTIRGVWKSMYIGWWSEEGEFEKKEMFEAEVGSEKAPVVK